MTIAVTHTREPDPEAAVHELVRGLDLPAPRFLLYFASPRYEPAALGRAMKGAFDCPTLGCTTAGEIASCGMLEGAIVAMAFDREHVASAATARVDDIQSPSDLRIAYARLVDSVAADNTATSDEFLGIVLQDGLSGAEERVMSLLSTLSNIPFVGGSAGDDARFDKTYVSVNGETFTGSAALGLLRMKKPYRILKTQSFDVTDTVLTVTEVDEAARRVQSFNGRPAAAEYARALSVSVEALPRHFQAHPLGLIAGNEPFVRSPQRVQGSDVLFYCNVKQGMQLRLLNARDIVTETEKALTEAARGLTQVEALVNFNCIQRKLELEQTQRLADYGALFRPFKSIGFSTYGESYIGHINQTSVMLLFQ